MTLLWVRGASSMFKVLALVLAMVQVCFADQGGRSQDAPSQVALAQVSNGKIQALVLDVAPFGFYAAGRKIQGAYYEVFKEVLATAKLDAEFRLVPYARASRLLGSQEARITMMFSNAVADQNGVQLGSFFKLENLVVPRLGVPVHSFSDLKNLKIGRMRLGCQDLVEKMGLQIQLVDLNDYDSGLRLLKSKRLDALCLSRHVYDLQLKTSHMDAKELEAPFVTNNREIMVYVSKGIDSKTAERIRSAFREVFSKKSILDFFH